MKIKLVFILCLTAIPAFIPLSAQETGNEESIENLFNQESSRDVGDQDIDRLQNSRRSFLPDINAAVDIVGRWDKEKNRDQIDRGRILIKDPEEAMAEKIEEWETPPVHATENKAVIRGAEIGFAGDIDQIGRGVVTLGVHEDEGETVMDLEEAFFLFPVTPIPRTSFKLGKFFYDAGRINRIHPHDWNFTDAPAVHRELLSDKNAGDVGIEASFLFPWSFWQELTVGVFNGHSVGHPPHQHEEEKEDSEEWIALENTLREELGLPLREPEVEMHDEEADSLQTRQNPLITVHLKQFFSFGKNWGTQFGFTYMRWHPGSEKHKVTHQSGIDFAVRWNRGRLRSFIWQSEIWYRETRDKAEHPWEEADPVETRAGAYTLFEYQFHQNWSAGIRFDGYHNPNYRGESGYFVSDAETEAQVLITWKPSEFSKFRFTGGQKRRYLYNDIDNTMSLQAVFIIGSHPQHQY
ncbi:MAG: hypothetical protein OEZ34_09920 [Spirochaetia bacterium]|nr:hypothetical protein [Spirochaetia bacterium]